MLFFIQLPIGDVLGERLDKSERAYKLKATLRNGKERVATFMLDSVDEMRDEMEKD